LQEYFDLSVGLWPFTVQFTSSYSTAMDKPYWGTALQIFNPIDAAAFKAAASQRVSLPADFTPTALYAIWAHVSSLRGGFKAPFVYFDQRGLIYLLQRPENVLRSLSMLAYN
jgi:hypothetical protein